MDIAGTSVALITPFTLDGKLDLNSFSNLINFVIDGGVESILVLGTTGEKPTINENEYRVLIERARVTAGKRVNIIAGSGSNSTENAIHLSKIAKDCGADATLSVGPYYNKPTDNGFYYHFTTIADKVDIPMILYNVPGRTGSNITLNALKKLCKHPNIIGIKEASADLDRVTEIMNFSPPSFAVLSGDDSLTLPMISLGAKGVISVVANVIPREMCELVKSALKSDLEKARRIHNSIYPLMKACFIESNPIPVKFILSLMGKIKANYRLPLVEPVEETKVKIRELLSSYKLV